MKIAVNAAAARRGGALTYFLNLLPILELRFAARNTFLIFASPEHVARFRALAPSLDVRPCPASGGALSRLAWDHGEFRAAARRERCDVMLVLNFPVADPPCPQVVWFRNARYFSQSFLAEIRRRGRMGEYLDSTARRALVQLTAEWCDMALFPTAAFRDEALARLPRVLPARVLPYAPDASAAEGECPLNIAEQMRAFSAAGKTLVFPSLPGTHKNLETALRAATRAMREDGDIRLLLPSFPGWEPALPDVLRERTAIFSPLPRSCMPELYRLADVVLFPSLCESFGLPLVEAMAAGRAVLASDTQTHREICADAARYYAPVFDAEAMAREILALVRDGEARRALGEKGKARAAVFSWEAHAEGLIAALTAAAGVEATS